MDKRTLRLLPRRELQRLAKAYAIPANAKSIDIIHRLLAMSSSGYEAVPEQTKRMKEEALPGSTLIPFLNRLKPKCSETWQHEDVMALAEAISGYGLVDGRNSPEDRMACLMFDEINDDLTAYASMHPDVQALLDPFYVQFIPPFAVNIQQAVATYPPPVSPKQAPAAVPNLAQNYFFQFPASEQGRIDAHQFIGHIQSQCPNQSVFTFTTLNLHRL